MRRQMGIAAMVAGVVLLLSLCLAAKAETISGVYSFTASDFNNIGAGGGSVTSPLQQISGSFGFSFSTDDAILNPNHEPGAPAWGSPLLMPTFAAISFGSFTTRVKLSTTSLYPTYLDLRLESEVASTEASPKAWWTRRIRIGHNTVGSRIAIGERARIGGTVTLDSVVPVMKAAAINYSRISLVNV